MLIRQFAHNIRNDMHHMAVAFDNEFFGWTHCAYFGDTTHIVAAQIQQHKMFGQFFFIAQQIRLKRAIFFGRCTAGACACNRANGDLAAFDLHQNLWACANDLIRPEIEEEHIGRRVRAPQRAIEGERWMREILRPALRGNNLKNIARSNIGLGLVHGGEIALFGEIGNGLNARCVCIHPQMALRDGRGLFELVERLLHPRAGRRIGGFRRNIRREERRRHQGYIALNPI